MIHNAVIYLLPYLASLGLSVGVLINAYQRRRAKGAAAYTWYIAGQTLWVLGFILEMVSSGLAEKIFWDGFQWLVTMIILVALPVFAVQYSEYTLKKPVRLLQLSLIVPILFAILLLTDNLHHLIYLNPILKAGIPFSELVYDFTPLIYVYALYSYGILLWAAGLLIRRFIQPHNLYRAQTALILLGFLIPSLATALPLLGIQIAPQRDATPFTAMAGNLCIAWSFFRFSLFKVVPVGRDRVFEAMVDPVVILDNEHHIVDINSSMLALLDKKAVEVIGKPAKKVFDNFPIPIKRYTHVSYARAEATFEVGGKSVFYEMTVWPIYDANKEMSGRIYISHDITALKDLEYELRELNLDLERRVRTRTSELAEAYDTTLLGWAKALELRDKETEGHSRRVVDVTLNIARRMEIAEEEINQIRFGALLHDIGKMGIPDHILRKEGNLTEKEKKIIQKHPETAYELLKEIPFLKHALEIPYCHHEKWDGSGYPQGLKGPDIPLSARIFAVADVWDALSTDRHYRKAWPKRQVHQYLIDEAGRHFDPKVVEVFSQLLSEGKI